MVSPISSPDLRYYIPVEAIRPVRAVERREEQEQVAPVSSETKDRRGSGSRGNFLREYVQDERRELAKLGPIRASLSPSDEVALFADEQAAAPLIGERPASNVTVGKAIADNGEEIAVESIAPQLIVSPAEAQAQDEKVIALNAQAQVQAAKAYARNNDIVFNNAPATLLAA